MEREYVLLIIPDQAFDIFRNNNNIIMALKYTIIALAVSSMIKPNLWDLNAATLQTALFLGGGGVSFFSLR